MNHAIDKLNIFLILISAVLAYFFPLELFIFSYAILGPLHYVTEIHWLNDNEYYFNGKRYMWVAISVLASVMIFLPKLYFEYGNIDNWFGDFMLRVNSWSNSAIFISLLLAIGSQFITSKKGWLVLTIISILGSTIVRDTSVFNDFFGLFIPTIIHVYVFTLIFMLYGAVKAKSNAGLIAVAIAITVPFIYIFIDLGGVNYSFSKPLKDVYLSNNFHLLPVVFSKYIGLSDGKTFFFYESMELKLMMFLSFIYLYHYLNWFSKTTVIKWHKNLNLKKSTLIIAIWLTCLVFYYVDFRLGFLFSIFISFLHVLLEFPLNILSIKGLIKSIKKLEKS